jgi:hypothetical protein
MVVLVVIVVFSFGPFDLLTTLPIVQQQNAVVKRKEEFFSSLESQRLTGAITLAGP